MSLSKKDPTLRVAANDPHLVSLGGGRLSTAVTIHNIPVGDCTIGSSLQCSVSLCGSGVKPVHCTIYRSEENQVTLVPEHNARILIDGKVIKNEIDLRQGAMITIGDSYYLRYNNPAEAQRMRTAIGDIFENDYVRDLDYFYETNIKPPLVSRQSDKSLHSLYDNLRKTQNSMDLSKWQCPKVFTADSVTVNMPAKDVLGQKYANFAKNLADNHRKDKNVTVHSTSQHIYNNLKSNTNFHHHDKIQYTSTPRKTDNAENCVLEVFSNERDPLEDMLKICTEYTDRQDRSFCEGNISLNSSPIVQNRIKTNGSLPREKKSPFYQDLQHTYHSNNIDLCLSPKSYQKSTGYENVHKLQQIQVDISESTKSSEYENAKLVPQSPRTKIRTNCMSPKNESDIKNYNFKQNCGMLEKTHINYEDLIKSFEDKFQREIDAIKDVSGCPLNTKKSFSNNSSPIVTRRTSKYINNLTIDMMSFVSPYNSPQLVKKSTPTHRKNNKIKTLGIGDLSNLLSKQSSYEELHNEREDLLQTIQYLKAELNSLQAQDHETLTEIDMENALVLAELETYRINEEQLHQELKALHKKSHRLEAQHNATRVMEENQQSKLKHSIEMKHDQVEKLKVLVNQKPNDLCLNEELVNVRESLENDKKSFEDLEFQYLEGESEWEGYREDLNLEEQTINKQIIDCRLTINNLEKQELNSLHLINPKQRRLSNQLLFLIKEIQSCEEQFKQLEKKLSLKINSNSSLSFHEEKRTDALGSHGQITQSLFGSTERLCPKHHMEDSMSQSVNENMFFNNKFEGSRNSINANILKSSEDIVRTNYKLYDTIKKIEKQRQLLATSKGRRDLDYEKRTIEELLTKLTSEAKQYSQNSITDNLTYNSPSTLSITDSVFSNKMSPDTIHKSVNELSISSLDSSRCFNTDNKCSSSLLSNHVSSQGDSSSVSCERKKTQKQKSQRPLTRYLPIFSDNLDLKHHIELAGHPISLCPHIYLDAYSCRGYLHKLGSTFHAWSKRWFVLDRQRRAIIYYADKSERKPRGGAYFSSIDEVYMDHLNISKSGRPHLTFIVKTKKKSYYLQAASDTAARIWIDVIITGAQGNINY